MCAGPVCVIYTCVYRMVEQHLENDEGFLWNSEKFLDVRRQFLENRSEAAAVDVLGKLLLIDPETVDACVLFLFVY